MEIQSELFRLQSRIESRIESQIESWIKKNFWMEIQSQLCCNPPAAGQGQRSLALLQILQKPLLHLIRQSESLTLLYLFKLEHSRAFVRYLENLGVDSPTFTRILQRKMTVDTQKN